MECFEPPIPCFFTVGWGLCIAGEKGREMDYQIWAGPSLGAFNSWVKGSYLEDYTRRGAVDVALHMLKGAAYLQRVNQLKLQGVSLTTHLASYRTDD